MALQQISAADIAGWDSLNDIASTFEKRGLKVRENFGDDNHNFCIWIATKHHILDIFALTTNHTTTEKMASVSEAIHYDLSALKPLEHSNFEEELPNARCPTTET
jgi:hypothetical protein